MHHARGVGPCVVRLWPSASPHVFSLALARHCTREPFLETRYEKTRDGVRLVWKGNPIMPRSPLPNALRPLFGKNKKNKKGKKGKGGGSKAGSGGGGGGGGGEGGGGGGSGKKGRMMSKDVQAFESGDESVYDGEMPLTNDLEAPQAGRRLFELPLCLEAEFTVMQPRTEQIFYLEITIPIWPGLAVVGAFEFSIEFQVMLTAQACIKVICTPLPC